MLMRTGGMQKPSVVCYIDQQISARIRVGRKHESADQLANGVFEADQGRNLHVAICQLEHSVFLTRFEIARYLVADDSREQWHSMPSRNVFTERHQMKFSIELHLFATIGNKQRGIVSMSVGFVDRAQQKVAICRCG